MAARANNLPSELTSLVGRDREIEALQQLLRDDGARLVTLTGPGGSGKTRLARELARALLDDFDDGAFFVSLAPTRDPGLVASAIAQTLDLRDLGAQPLLRSLKSHLRDRSLLLLLDNFEQVLEAGPMVTDLLASCPRLQIVVTSRAALRVTGEREFPVPPLALPGRDQLSATEELGRYAAVGLFVDRARAVNPDVRFEGETLREVAEICARLDGLPLAIELAAARSKLFTPSAMVSRLDRRLPFLAGGARDLPERQRTLRGAIAWSYDLLTPAEQRLFRRSSIFVDGCNLESAETVCELPPAGTGDEQVDALEAVASLLDKNLIRRVEAIGTQTRFGMLETIREFGLEMLAASEELEAVQQRHAQHFLALAEEADGHIPGSSQDEWLALLEQEHDNLRTALRWYSSRHDSSRGLQLAGALGQFWQLRGHVSEGRTWLESLLSDGAPVNSPERAKALTSVGMLALYQSDFSVARRSHEQSLAIHEAAGDRWSTAIAVNDLGTVALYQGDYSAARGLYEQSLALRQELGDQRGSAVSLTNLGLVAQALGESAEARRRHEECLGLRRELHDAAGVARSLSRLGTVATDEGDLEAAQAYLSEAVALAREQGDSHGLAASLTNLGSVALELGDFPRSGSLLEEGLALRRQLGDTDGIARSLWHLCRLAEEQGDLDSAVAYCERALPARTETGDRRGAALWRMRLGDLLLRQGDAAGARLQYEQSLALRRQIGDEGAAAIVLGKLAQVSYQDSDPAMTRRLLEESVTSLRAVGERQALAASLTNLAQVAGSQGDHTVSEQRYREALSIEFEQGDPKVVSLCLAGLATAALARGDRERAALLFGASERTGHSSDRVDGERAESDSAFLGRFSGALESSIVEARRAGRTLSLEAAIDLALAEPSVPAPAEDAIEFPDGLSGREVEVLRLIARGRSNPEIAAELFISVNTVYRHVSHIFGKTGALNRVEAATYAQRHGLA